MTRNVAIVGGAPSYKGAPFNDPEWEIWGLGSAFNLLPEDKVDLWLEIHCREVIDGVSEEVRPDYKDWLFANTDRSPVMIFPDSGMEDVIHSKIFPRQKIEKRFGNSWWSSSVAWIIALILEECDGKIGLFGVEMCADEEYGQQQMALQHFMDIARLTGRDIVMANGCNLLHPVKVYPDYGLAAGFKHCRREVERLTKDKVAIDAQTEVLKLKSSYVEGALAVYDHLMRNNWV